MDRDLGILAAEGTHVQERCLLVHTPEPALTSCLVQQFDVARATELTDRRYELVCFFDTLHDLRDPVGAVPGTSRSCSRRAPCC
ncbi:MAG: hypothetical protein RL033_1312 [Pseudomonadota bacterium]